MSGDVINLRQRRKQAAREDRKRRAAANARKFGQSKPERRLQALREVKATRHLEGHRLSETERPAETAGGQDPDADTGQVPGPDR